MNKLAEDEFESVLAFVRNNEQARKNLKRYFLLGNTINKTSEGCVYAAITGKRSGGFLIGDLIPKEITASLAVDYTIGQVKFSNLERFIEYATDEQLLDVENKMKACLTN